MIREFESRRVCWRNLGLTALILGGLSIVGASAQAGECPADKQGVDLTEPTDVAAKDVTDMVLGAIDLEKEPAAIDDRTLRLRRLEIQPGGIVPWHSHGDRPAIIYVVSGEVLEYASDCAVPIVHSAGEVSIETNGVSHWWQNKGTEKVILLSADILHDPADMNM